SHGRVTFHLAAPVLGRTDAEGQPVKTEFGPWMARAFALLRHGKHLRGTPFDPFGHTAERRMERQLARDYEALLVCGGITGGRSLAPTLANLWNELLSRRRPFLKFSNFFDEGISISTAKRRSNDLFHFLKKS
ncbi:MAG: DUF6537 domain-containing protein, partial [Verrucomicrobiota bacterium]